jgi:hypothetical protein
VLNSPPPALSPARIEQTARCLQCIALRSLASVQIRVLAAPAESTTPDPSAGRNGGRCLHSPITTLFGKSVQRVWSECPKCLDATFGNLALPCPKPLPNTLDGTSKVGPRVW